MPGLVGLISRQSPDTCRDTVQRMLGTMRHEDFYTSGTHDAADLGIFTGWVAHRDSFADRQPVRSEHGDVAFILSGECFPDADTIAHLITRGHRVSATDPTWLLRLYEEKGEPFVDRLNGLFSGLLIDHRQQTAYLFNDRYGMERIYYYEGDQGFFFASEAKALLSVLPQTRAFDDDALAEFLEYGCTLQWKSLFQDIKLLPAASLWTFVRGRNDKRRYFVPTAWERQPTLPAQAFSDQLQAAFLRVLPRYLDPQSRVGISLTGGLDTRMIMAVRPRTDTPLVSYTFAGGTSDTLDARLAASVAAACNVPHHIIRLRPDFFSSFASLVDRTIYATDGYFGVCGAHEIYLHEHARRLAAIRLTGNFGSEILRGSTTFKPMRLSNDLLHPDLRARTAPVEHPRHGVEHPVSFAAFREIPWHLFGAFKAAQSQLTWRSPYIDNELVALAYQAPDRLRTSSAPALSFVRQHDSGLSRIPTDGGLVAASRVRSLLNYPWARASFKLDYWCGEGMPNWIAPIDTWLSDRGLRLWTPGRHKFLHYVTWFRGPLAAYVTERLTDTATQRQSFWNTTALERIADEHIAGEKNNVREIDAVLTLETINRTLLRQTA